MPVITIDGPVFSLENKEKLAKEMTQMVSDVTNIP
jgi:phenylpyruvate tautomerase PptA (4-oxalocrotonate tautomerase family)